MKSKPLAADFFVWSIISITFYIINQLIVWIRLSFFSEQKSKNLPHFLFKVWGSIVSNTLRNLENGANLWIDCWFSRNTIHLFNKGHGIFCLALHIHCNHLFLTKAHYVFLATAFFFRKDVKREAVFDMGRRLALYGIAALLSVNFLQYGIYHAICAWVLLIIVVILNGMLLMRGVEERTRGIMILLYYIVLGIWYFGIFFFYLFNALDWCDDL